MKKSVIIILATMLLGSTAFASGKHHEKINYPDPQFNIIQQLPYSSSGVAVMEKVISKDEYTLYKCPSSYVTNFPGQSITGKNYNYFVYKNNEFHMTVNENNKNDIYNFLTK
ncbi:MAG: hypothetical protein C0596_18840 [Marinilabiliales bacterium]|nr:MAG: hypothetical protein C0596_18840 [Marinilabiliales bacterium]